jgi:hypothetical protein
LSKKFSQNKLIVDHFAATKFSFKFAYSGCHCSRGKSASDSESLGANHRIFASALHPSAFEKQGILKTPSAYQRLDLQANLQQ